MHDRKRFLRRIIKGGEISPPSRTRNRRWRRSLDDGAITKKSFVLEVIELVVVQWVAPLGWSGLEGKRGEWLADQ